MEVLGKMVMFGGEDFIFNRPAGLWKYVHVFGGVGIGVFWGNERGK